MSTRILDSCRSLCRCVVLSLVLICGMVFNTRHAAAQGPSQIPRTLLERQIKMVVDPYVSQENHLYWRDSRNPVRVTRYDQQTIHARLKLAYEVNNWFDPDVNVDFNLRVSCSDSKLILEMSDFKLGVDHDWYSSVLSLGIVEFFDAPDGAKKKIRKMAESLPLPSLPVSQCPTVSVNSDGDIVLLAIPGSVSAASNQVVRIDPLCGTTDANGFFSLHTRDPQISFALVAVQHQNGNWHRLEQSMYVDNNIWWNSQVVAGWIRSPQFANRPVCAQIFKGLTTRPSSTYVMTGYTDGNGRFSISTGGVRLSLAMTAVQHPNGNWHTIEQSMYVDNNFWWNDQAVAGWITSPAFANRPVRVLAVTGGWDITGKTDNNGRFSLPLPWPLGLGCIYGNGSDGFEQHVAFAAVAVQHPNGNWHTVEQSRYIDNNFWWNNEAVAGWITSPAFSNRPIRTILFKKGRVCIG